jgi:alanine racemase
MDQITYLEIQLDHLCHNVTYLRSIAGQERMICGVIKANAYGHGCVEMAKQLVALGVERLATTCVRELIALRNAGISVPIHIMSVVHPCEREVAVEIGCTPFIGSVDEAIDWNRAAVMLGKKMQVHLEINSQMNRLGVDFSQSAALIESIEQASHLELEGVALHLSMADVAGDASMLGDIEKVEQLRSRYPNLIYHVASSAALANYRQSMYNMIRPGLALYGYGMGNQLKPILSWVTSVVQIRQVAADAPVSYGATYRTTQPSYLAVLPVGYADGYPREFAEQAYVLIKQKRYPVVGRVCMNHLMVDLGDKHEVKLFDKAYLIHDTLLDAEALAKASASISYRVLTGLERNLPRRYLLGGQEIACCMPV